MQYQPVDLSSYFQGFANLLINYVTQTMGPLLPVLAIIVGVVFFREILKAFTK